MCLIALFVFCPHYFFVIAALKEVTPVVEAESKMEDTITAPVAVAAAAPVSVVEPLNNMNWDLDALLATNSVAAPAPMYEPVLPAVVLATSNTISQGQGRKVKMVYDNNDQFVGFAECYGKKRCIRIDTYRY